MNGIKEILIEQLDYLSKYAKDSRHTGTDVANITIAMVLLSKAIDMIECKKIDIDKYIQQLCSLSSFLITMSNNKE